MQWFLSSTFIKVTTGFFHCRVSLMIFLTIAVVYRYPLLLYSVIALGMAPHARLHLEYCHSTLLPMALCCLQPVWRQKLLLETLLQPSDTLGCTGLSKEEVCTQQLLGLCRICHKKVTELVWKEATWETGMSTGIILQAHILYLMVYYNRHSAEVAR